MACVRVVVKWRAVALVAILEAEEAHPADIATELVTQVGRHRLPVLLGNEVVIPPLLKLLRVDDAANAPEACGATLGVDVVDAGEFWNAVRMHHLLLHICRPAHRRSRTVNPHARRRTGDNQRTEERCSVLHYSIKENGFSF
jgi:hypothetical protein